MMPPGCKLQVPPEGRAWPTWGTQGGYQAGELHSQHSRGRGGLGAGAPLGAADSQVTYTLS